jgi:hypothetical protein
MGHDLLLSRIGLGEGQTLIDPFLEAGIPAVQILGEYGEEAEPGGIWSRRFIRSFWLLLDSLAGGLPGTWDRHYLFLRIGGRSVLLREGHYLIVMASVIGLFILLVQLPFGRPSAGHPSAGRRYAGRRYADRPNTGGKFRLATLRSLFLLYLSGYGALLAGSGLITGLGWIKRYPEAWTVDPLYFLLFKVAVVILVMILLYPLTKGSEEPVVPYSSLAQYSLLAVVLLLAFFSISLTFYFLWAFFFMLIALAVSHRFIALPFLLIAPSWLLMEIYRLFVLSRPAFIRALLLTDFGVNAILALVLLPVTLLTLDYTRRILKPRGRATARLAGLGFFAIASVGLCVLLVTLPSFGARNPQGVVATQRFAQASSDSRIDFESSAHLGLIHYRSGRISGSFDTASKRHSVQLPLPDALTPADPQEDFQGDTGGLLSVEARWRPVLDRTGGLLTLDMAGVPYRLELILSSPAPFDLSGTSYPFEERTMEGGSGYAFLRGRFPPSPLALALTLPTNLSFTLDIELEYRQPPFPFEVTGEEKRIERRVILTERHSFDT